MIRMIFSMPMFVLKGIIAGITAGIVMGVVSDFGYRIGIFKSSLVLIDGSFILNLTKGKIKHAKIYLFGIPAHLLTSAVFGGGYVFTASLLKLNLSSPQLLSLYVFFLWVSMLLIALPAAGQGLLGKKIGSFTWMEQLLLHVFYGSGLWGALLVVF